MTTDCKFYLFIESQRKMCKTQKSYVKILEVTPAPFINDAVI